MSLPNIILFEETVIFEPMCVPINKLLLAVVAWEPELVPILILSSPVVIPQPAASLVLLSVVEPINILRFPLVIE